MRRILILISACLTIISCLVSGILAADFSGPVVSVLDGDTRDVQRQHLTDDKIKDQSAEQSRIMG